MLNKILLLVGILFFAFAVLIIRPVPIVAEEKADVCKGKVVGIYEGGVKDVVFRLEGDHRRFYINRGLENGLTIQELREELIGKEVTLKYPKYWTPLDWDSNTRHLSKVQYQSKVIFNELKE